MIASQQSITLTGLDGANPLGFLAALGTLRVLTATCNVDKPPTLSWVQSCGGWRPIIALRQETDRDHIIAQIDEYLRSMVNHPALTFDNNLRLPQPRHRSLAIQAIQDYVSNDDTISHQFFSAFGCDGITDDQGRVEDTALRTMSGGGHQHFVKFMHDLVRETNANHLLEALFGPWKYADPGPSLRFDPIDDRRYALRWKDPGSDAIQTVRGANRLAVEGIPLLYTVPVGGRLETCGFSGHRSSNTFWTWPIWTVPVSVNVCKSLLALKGISGRGESFNYDNLKARGIESVYSSQRITVGKYRNFTPANQKF